MNNARNYDSPQQCAMKEEKASELEQSLNYLSNRLDSMNRIISDLESKLRPVMTPECPREVEESNRISCEPTRSPTVTALHSYDYILNTFVSRIETIVKRLEV